MLETKGLRTHFYTESGVALAVDGVDLRIHRGETVGVVGESGCGKSVTALSILRLVKWPGRIVSGEVWFEGRDLLRLDEAKVRRIRGKEIGMIFQEPMTALNPVFTIGEQIAETIRAHDGTSRNEAWRRAVEMLKMVGMPLAEQRAREYPHQLSGGMRQRAMIAISLACTPKLLIADEPTTALDVTIQAQILELMKDLQRELQMAIMLITHDLGMVAEMVERVVVMYAGQVVEEASTEDLFREPLHPYAEGLLSTIPRLDGGRGRLRVIEGTVPDPLAFPPGCRFGLRCAHVMPVCRERIPELIWVESGRAVRCWLMVPQEEVTG